MDMKCELPRSILQRVLRPSIKCGKSPGIILVLVSNNIINMMKTIREYPNMIAFFPQQA
ncbi:conserved hypothetical protein [Ricinus communis]|uniref:Uncharacterized protein n=1 Tax=Ricinus communis TaxID=3988 RepID=B9T7C1_RICCO|nr:conserved hypothetical protein [Ricinus communis]